ncbi:MAG: cob(I)yrinic acid a,c-diamide adenosyltransferase [Bacteroidota bacterium]
MKIYTKTGDKGTTALFGGTRVSKHHIRIDSYGTVDELNSWLGLVRDQEIDSHLKKVVTIVQDKLFTVGAILATDPKKAILKSGKERLNIPKIDLSDIELLEKEIDNMNDSLPPMTHFILPGGHTTVSYCHIARTVCRRAERLASHLHVDEPFEENVLSYINRLSDYLFVLARKLSQDLQAEEVKWIPEKKD